MKVHEGIVPVRVLIVRQRVVCDVDAAKGNVAAGRRLARRDIAHVFHVRAPGEPTLCELIGDRLHGRRIYTTVADRLTERRGASLDKVGIDAAVSRRRAVGRLAADHRNVVVETEVPRAVVLSEESTALRE